ncbi:hypothetical protein ACOZ4B_13840 [Haloferax prahovense]|uniref:hypothetical protein n=1 Tax=Haloferax prahovense TaxID=381852 RepID=UPI003C73671C
MGPSDSYNLSDRFIDVLIAFGMGLSLSGILQILGIDLSLAFIFTVAQGAVVSWTEIAIIDSPVSFVLISVILTTLSSAIIKSNYRDSPSPTISGILRAPGVHIWFRLATKILEWKYVGSFVFHFAHGIRLNFWVFSLLTFILVISLRIYNLTSNLLIAAVSVLLASISFGTIFGSFDKGLVLSIDSTIDATRKQEVPSEPALPQSVWGAMLPVSILFSTLSVYWGLRSLNNPDIPTQIASSLSIFFTTFLAMISLFYLIALVAMARSFLHQVRDEYRNNELNFRETWAETKEKRRNDNVRENREYGFPEEVAESLRSHHDTQE